jgi:hypothetical protein
MSDAHTHSCSRCVIRCKRDLKKYLSSRAMAALVASGMIVAGMVFVGKAFHAR